MKSKTANKPVFIITIDTEGDNLWSAPSEIKTENTKYLPRFQQLCEKYGFKPTYLTNYEMAMDDDFVAFGREIIQKSTGEIGMHLHAWNSPPIKPISEDDNKYRPYLIDFDEEIMVEKIKFMTQLLEERFSCKITSHRAGRWAFNEFYAKTLKELGYIVDCSVTPGMSWKEHTGAPSGSGGTDYRNFPTQAYKMSLDDISKPSKDNGFSLYQVPMTVIHRRPALGKLIQQFSPDIEFFKKVRQKLSPIYMFRSRLGNYTQLKWAVEKAVATKQPYLEYMLHSSEFMPGGSPNFKNEQEIEQLYNELEKIFALIFKYFAGQTLSEYARNSINE